MVAGALGKSRRRVNPSWFPELRDGDVTVRIVRLRDSKALWDLLIAHRSWLGKWEATYPSQSASVAPTAADVRANVKSLLAATREGTAIGWVIELDGVPVGQLNVSAVMRGSTSSAAIGYWVSESVAGRGVMTRAVALVTDFCLGPFGLHRIEVCIRPENRPSQRIVEKLGFRFEGRRRRFIHINGAWADHFCYALTREDVPGGVLARFRNGAVPADAARVPDELRAEYPD
ncbi:MAG TPA: GNAT family protein [Microbacteriaceae bacterium]|nr:GNAT family protein [Microbacteriaceae bacterium]